MSKKTVNPDFHRKPIKIHRVGEEAQNGRTFSLPPKPPERPQTPTSTKGPKK